MALVTEITPERVATDRVTSVPLSWTNPESQLWIANRQGEYAGMVEYADGHFLASGSRGEDFGSFSDRTQAMEAVRLATARRRLPDGLLSNVAIVSAVVAVSIAGMSLTMIAA
ncbi:hypothetical protein [Herbiconiux sp.]|jgi:hypothetical protein|uniref:hypothetical protein n=1 Tax=Herbiconiux sp. TaxID=1871186 RepID=UPI0025C27A2D|nr:hypothetical protein [Herbiconiux sp.]